MDTGFSKTEGLAADVGPVMPSVGHQDSPDQGRLPARDGIRLGYHWLCLLAICLAGALVYAQTLHYPFVFDDDYIVQNNTHIRINHLSLQELSNAAFKTPVPNRPLEGFTLSLNYYFGKYDVTGYHLTNIAIHLLAGMLVYFVSFLTFRRMTEIPNQAFPPPHGSRILVMSLIAALIFVTHPVQVQAVTYISQRMTSLATMLYLLSLLCYIVGRESVVGWQRRTWWAGCLIFGALAFGSKEIAATLPVVIFIYEWFFFQNLSFNWLKRSFKYLAIPVVVLVLLTVIFSEGKLLHKFTSEAYPILSCPTPAFTAWERVMTEWRVVLFYLSLLFYPHPQRLNLLHPITVSHSLFDPITTFLSLLAILGCLGLALAAARRHRLLSFCILWYFINLVIESSVIKLEFIYQYRLYLPLVALAVYLPYLIYRLTLKMVGVGVIISGVIIVALGFSTYSHNLVWRDNVTLWSDVVSKNPLSHNGHSDLGVALITQGNIREATSHLRQALQLKPDFANAHINLGLILAEQGDEKAAIEHYSKALDSNPRLAKAHYNLGVVLAKQGKVEESLNHFYQAVKYEPDSPYTHYNLAQALAEQEKTAEAGNHYAEAIRLNEDFAEAHNGLGAIYERHGQTAKAMDHYLTALRIGPDNPYTNYNLGHLLAESGRMTEALGYLFEAVRAKADYVEAQSKLEDILADPRSTEECIRFFAQAIQLEPNNADAHYFLSLALVKYGDTDSGAGEAGEALRLRPGFAEAHNSLGAALLGRGDIDGAVKQFSEAARINPEYAGAWYNLGMALAGRGDIQGAVNHYLEAIKIKPDYAEAYNNLGAALAGQGKIKEAAACFSAAVRFNPDYAMAHNNLGMTLMDQGNVPEAAKQFSEAVRINPDYPEALYNLGRALMAQGRTDQAIRRFSAALKLVPDFPQARRSLEEALRQP
ncbi:MAG: tetratricopeptide repeat protein [Deltaproteobacteria bacterium]|nr:tetratricopeptide repeat protein [Deltaproteobacteria bacterium]